VKPASPKKETARIQVPPTAKPTMPKATVKMQQTQPLAPAPAAAITKAPAPATVSAAAAEAEPAADPLVGILGWVAAAAALVALGLTYAALSAAG
jgi:hypothetical protein